MVEYQGFQEDHFLEKYYGIKPAVLTGEQRRITRVPERVEWASLPERVRKRNGYQRDPSQMLYSSYRIDPEGAFDACDGVLETFTRECEAKILELRERTIISFIAMGVDAYAETMKTKVDTEREDGMYSLTYDIRMLPLRRTGETRYGIPQYVAWDQSIQDWERAMRLDGVTFSVTDLPDIDTIVEAFRR